MATPTTYYSGIDLHKQTSFITTIDEHGQRVQQQKLKKHPDALRSYFRQHEGDHRAVVESTTG
jgi:hypothetical protein